MERIFLKEGSKMTPEQLIKISPYTKPKSSVFAPLLTTAMSNYDINTPIRQAAFIAQILHESGNLVYTEEIASGAAYEFRKDLGNTQAGDGVKFKGRGLLQITGKANYIAVMMALGTDCLAHPELLATPENAALTAAWWWKEHGLNEMSDTNTDASFIQITRKINGGINGLADRQAIWKSAKNVLGVF